MSMPDALNVLIASIGVQTIGSPITLKLVFSNIGMPEYFSNALSNLYSCIFDVLVTV